MNNYTTPQQMPTFYSTDTCLDMFSLSFSPSLYPSASTPSPWLGPTYYIVSTS